MPLDKEKTNINLTIHGFDWPNTKLNIVIPFES